MSEQHRLATLCQSRLACDLLRFSYLWVYLAQRHDDEDNDGDGQSDGQKDPEEEAIEYLRDLSPLHVNLAERALLSVVSQRVVMLYEQNVKTTKQFF